MRNKAFFCVFFTPHLPYLRSYFVQHCGQSHDLWEPEVFGISDKCKCEFDLEKECNTEGWSNEAEYVALHHRNTLH